MLCIATRKANSSRRAKEKEQEIADVSNVGEMDIALRIAEVPPLREKAKAKASPKEKVRERLKVRIKEARGQRLGALPVADRIMHPRARKAKAAKPASCRTSSQVGNPTNGATRANREPHGDNRANRELTTQCPTPWVPMGHRGFTQLSPNAIPACLGRASLGSRIP